MLQLLQELWAPTCRLVCRLVGMRIASCIIADKLIDLNGNLQTCQKKRQLQCNHSESESAWTALQGSMQAHLVDQC